MIRKAFLMRLKPGCQAEYARRHHPIWPELQAALKAHGAHNYSTRRPTNCSLMWRLSLKNAGRQLRAPKFASAGGSTCGI